MILCRFIVKIAEVKLKIYKIISP